MKKKSSYGIRTLLEIFGKYQNIDVYPLYTIENIFKNK
jgi:hypothetical protein